MFQKTFDGRTVDLTKMSQQHLSNAYYFGKIQRWPDKVIGHYLVEINNRFNNELLPYRPMVNFPQEIRMLTQKGLLKGKEVWFEGIKIGEIDDELITHIDDLK